MSTNGTAEISTVETSQSVTKGTNRAPDALARPTGKLRAGRTTPPPVETGGCRALAPRTEITRAQIRDRAYFIYLARNGAPGNAESDWIQAESELRAEARH